jgi:S-adenosyl-L-methionine hydrolase (adenosine-forming)
MTFFIKNRDSMDMSAPVDNKRAVIALLTDFGLSDTYVGVMKGVIASIVPDARLIDITHAIPPQQIVSGAWQLAMVYRFFPRGTVFLCVVDPGVGSARGAIALHAGDWSFVGPDNGLFSYVYAEQPVHRAVTLANTRYRLSQVSTTFHGRDVFSPAAAHLARGVGLAEFGPALDPASLERLDVQWPVRENGTIAARVVHIDHYGNIVTNIPLALVPDLFDEQVRVRAVFAETGAVVEQRARFFAAVTGSAPLLYTDSTGTLGVAVRDGNAAQALGVHLGSKVTLTLTML